MTPIHVHLLINHLPILGVVLGGIVLAHGLWTRSNETKVAAYTVIIISALGGYLAIFSGHAAEEAVEAIEGIAENMIEQHEDAASVALVGLILLGISSVFGLIVTLKESSNVKSLALITLFISVLSFGSSAWTGYLGGQIRHTELNNTSATNQWNLEDHEHNEHEHNDDD